VTLKTVTITSGSTWTVPSDWATPWTIHLIGAGGGPSSPFASSGLTVPGGTGAGAAYAQLTNASLTLSAGQTVYVSLGVGGAAGSGYNGGTGTVGTAGTDTWLNASSNAAPTLTSQGALAKGGSGSSVSNVVALGGQASACVGTIAYSGGDGGGPGFVPGQPGGGGGGAGGPTGAGYAGAQGGSGSPGVGGVGGAAGTGGPLGPTSVYPGMGGQGGNTASAGSTPATPGAAYGGGGGAPPGDNTAAVGGAGAAGVIVIVYTQASPDNIVENASAADSVSQVNTSSISFSEAATAATALLRSMSAPVMVSEAGTGTTSITVKATLSLAEAASGATILTPVLSASRTLAEAASALNTQTFAFASDDSLSENSSATASQSGTMSASKTLAESAAGTSSQSGVLHGTLTISAPASGAVVETLLMTAPLFLVEQAGLGVGIGSFVIGESWIGLAAQDYVSAALVGHAVLAEAVTATSSQVAHVTASGSLAEAASATAMVNGLLEIVLHEAANAQSSVSYLPEVFDEYVWERGTAADHLTATLVTASASLSERAMSHDAVGANGALPHSLGELADGTVALLVGFVVPRSITEAASANDNATTSTPADIGVREIAAANDVLEPVVLGSWTAVGVAAPWWYRAHATPDVVLDLDVITDDPRALDRGS
jgi:hypothetical protein